MLFQHGNLVVAQLAELRGLLDQQLTWQQRANALQPDVRLGLANLRKNSSAMLGNVCLDQRQHRLSELVAIADRPTTELVARLELMLLQMRGAHLSHIVASAVPFGPNAGR